MQKRSSFLVTVAAASILLLGVGCSVSTGSSTEAPANGPAIGERVLVDWYGDGESWWVANVDSYGAFGYTVTYELDNDTDEDLSLSRIAPFPRGAAAVTVGDTVVAEWLEDTYFAGTVTALNADGTAHIVWYDDDEEDVALNKITQPFE